MIYCVLDEATCGDLLESFGQFIGTDTRDLMKSILDWDVENFCSKEKLDSLKQLKCRSLLTKYNTKTLLEEIARQQLIQNHFWWPLAGKTYYQSWKVTSLVNMFCNICVEKKPSYRKLLNLLSFNSAKYAGRDSLLYQKRYIWGLDIPQLCKVHAFLILWVLRENGKSKTF